MRREPNKASKDSANGKQSRLSTSRRRSISCSRLAPSPQMDVTEMRKLATPKASTHEPPTRNRVRRLRVFYFIIKALYLSLGRLARTQYKSQCAWNAENASHDLSKKICNACFH
eukprot:g4320.t2